MPVNLPGAEKCLAMGAEGWEAVARSYGLHYHKADIVPVACIAAAGVAKTRQKKQGLLLFFVFFLFRHVRLSGGISRIRRGFGFGTTGDGRHREVTTDGGCHAIG